MNQKILSIIEKKLIEVLDEYGLLKIECKFTSKNLLSILILLKPDFEDSEPLTSQECPRS